MSLPWYRQCTQILETPSWSTWCDIQGSSYCPRKHKKKASALSIDYLHKIQHAVIIKIRKDLALSCTVHNSLSLGGQTLTGSLAHTTASPSIGIAARNIPSRLPLWLLCNTAYLFLPGYAVYSLNAACQYRISAKFNYVERGLNKHEWLRGIPMCGFMT